MRNILLILKPVKNNKIISSVLVDGIKLQLSIERATPAQARQSIFKSREDKTIDETI